MKIGERGQVTIPKEMRERFGFKPATEVQFRVVRDSLIIQKKPAKLKLEKWAGHCRKNFARLGYKSVDHFIEDIRGR